MTVRTASCRCGQLSAACTGEPIRVSVCHCRDCKRRSGSAFAAQVRFPADQVRLTGPSTEWVHVGENGAGYFNFCPVCGCPVWYRVDAMPDVIAVVLGAFTDPDFPPPEYSVFEGRKLPWVEITGAEVAHYD